jgi:CBS domain-containing protein
MGTVSDILRDKPGISIFSTLPNDSVLDATQLMIRYGVGALLVMEGENLLGIFTERDVLRRIVAERRNPLETSVADVMTRNVICCTLETSIDEARSVMKNRRIRHLPVLGPLGDVLGVISIGDLNAYHTSHQESTIHLLHEYLHGRA